MYFEEFKYILIISDWFDAFFEIYTFHNNYILIIKLHHLINLSLIRTDLISNFLNKVLH